MCVLGNLSGGLYKIPIRTGLDLGRKSSVKIHSALMQKLGLQLYEIEFLIKQATPPPLRERSLTRSYPSISGSLLKTVLSSLVSLKVVCRVQIWLKKHFVKIVQSLFAVLFKKTLHLCIYFVFRKETLF